MQYILDDNTKGIYSWHMAKAEQVLTPTTEGLKGKRGRERKRESVADLSQDTV